MKLLTGNLLLMLVIFLSSCHQQTLKNNAEKDSNQIKEEIAETWISFFDAWVQGDAEKCAQFFSEDGIHFRPAANIDTGRTRIEESFSYILSSYKVEYCTQKTLEIEINSRTIIEYGTYTQKWAVSNDETIGSYFAIWENDRNDSLKISRLIFN